MLSASPNHQQLTDAIIAAKAKQSKMVLRKFLFVLHEYRYYGVFEAVALLLQ